MVKKNEAEVPSSGTSQVLLSVVYNHECVKMCLHTAMDSSPLISLFFFSFFFFFFLLFYTLKSNLTYIN